MNLTYSQLLADLHALNLHQLAETNVEVVTNDRGSAFLSFDTSENETTALRKRKGIDANYFRLRDDIIRFVFGSNSPEARKLKAELYTK